MLSDGICCSFNPKSYERVVAASLWYDRAIVYTYTAQLYIVKWKFTFIITRYFAGQKSLNESGSTSWMMYVIAMNFFQHFSVLLPAFHSFLSLDFKRLCFNSCNCFKTQCKTSVFWLFSSVKIPQKIHINENFKFLHKSTMQLLSIKLVRSDRCVHQNGSQSVILCVCMRFSSFIQRYNRANRNIQFERKDF